jgi:hypothetical protein
MWRNTVVVEFASIATTVKAFSPISLFVIAARSK